jgi:hypothetical protein
MAKGQGRGMEEESSGASLTRPAMVKGQEKRGRLYLSTRRALYVSGMFRRVAPYADGVFCFVIGWHYWQDKERCAATRERATVPLRSRERILLVRGLRRGRLRVLPVGQAGEEKAGEERAQRVSRGLIDDQRDPVWYHV